MSSRWREKEKEAKREKESQMEVLIQNKETREQTQSHLIPFNFIGGAEGEGERREERQERNVFQYNSCSFLSKGSWRVLASVFIWQSTTP